MTDLVERHRSPEKFTGDPEFYPKEIARLKAALEAAQAQAAGVRRETIAECAKIARSAFDDRPRIRAGNVDWSDGYDEATRAAEAAIRALTDAAKGDRT